MKKIVKITALAVVFLIAGTFLAINYVNVTRSEAVIVRAGSNVGDIKVVQSKLKQWGYYNGRVDGDYGKKTVAAVRTFQQKYNLSADGIVGPATLGKMGVMVGLSVSSNVVRKGAAASDIRKVQQRLKDLGYYQGAIDGIFGSVSTQAAKNYQRDNNLTVDGIVGRNTLASLGIAIGGGGAATTNSQSKGGSNPPGNADSYLLARCIYAEARGEPYEGQVAIGAVILNRVKHSDFPNTISGVIYQPRAFTVVADGQINLSPDSTAQRAAQDALNGWDPTNGCIFYYNPATATSQWIYSRTVILTIGKHVFCV